MTTKTTKTTKPGTGGVPTALERVAAALTAHPGSTTADIALSAETGHSTTGKALSTLEKTGRARREKGGRDHNNRATPDRWHPTTTPDTDTSTDTTATEETSASEHRADTGNVPVGTIAQDDGPTPQPEPDTQQEQERAPAANANTHMATDTDTDTDLSRTSGLTAAEVGTPPPAPAAEAAAILPAPASGGQPAEAPAVSETAAALESPTAGGVARLAPGALRQLVVEHLTAHPEEAFTATAISRVIERSSGAIANALATLTRKGIARQVTDHPRRYQLATPPGDQR
jgi:hypothetical protein